MQTKRHAIIHKFCNKTIKWSCEQRTEIASLIFTVAGTFIFIVVHRCFKAKMLPTDTLSTFSFRYMKLHITHKTLPGMCIYAMGKTYIHVRLQVLLQLELRLTSIVGWNFRGNNVTVRSGLSCDVTTWQSLGNRVSHATIIESGAATSASVNLAYHDQIPSCILESQSC